MSARAFILAALALAGCTLPEHSKTGPEIHITLDQGFSVVTDQSFSNEFDLDGDTAYSVDVRVDTYPGEDDQYNSAEVETPTVTFTVPSVALPSVTLDGDGFAGFTSRAPLVIPASAKGRMLAVHADALDSNGLESNLIDLVIELN